MDDPPPTRVLVIVAAETRYHIFIPQNEIHPPDGTTFMVDLACSELREAWVSGARRTMEIVLRQSPQDLAQSSDYQGFTFGSRYRRYLYAFRLPLRPADLSLRFRIPMVRLRFFPANEDRLPLSH